MQKLVLELSNIEKSYMSEDILRIGNLKIYENEKIGIIGDNGSGKSTLLNLIAGKIKPDIGFVNRHIDFEYYEQIAEQIQPDFASIDAEYLSRLNVPNSEIGTFSGGEMTRLRLADLFSTYQFGLLLDEPTTHLDKEGVQFLVNQLKYYYGTLIAVSHNRYFLDEVVDTIWEIKYGKVNVYNGNYTDYRKQKEHEIIEQERAHEQFVKEKNRLEQAAKEKQIQAEKMNNVGEKQKNRAIRPDRYSSSKQKDSVQKAAHKSAKAIQKRADQLEDVNRLETERTLHFPQPKYLVIHNDYPIMAQDLTIKKGEKLLFNQASFQLPLGKRIGITGPNGSGKSTLLQHILNNGDGITLSSKILFSVYKQMDYQLFADYTMLEYLKRDSDFDEAFIRSVLNNLGFEQTEIIKKQVKNLSGGEATRLVIAKLFTDTSNVLILDEPTNFIDMRTIEALELLMKNYQGTILFTSHDQYFMSNVAEQIWKIENKQLKLVEY